jgi:hypothetical protein
MPVVFLPQQNVFLLDKGFWLFSAIIFYLTYPIIYCKIWANKERIILANIISFWLNNKCKVVRHATPVPNVPMDKGLEFQY